MTRAEFREAMVKSHGEPFTISYFDRSGWEEGKPNLLRPWSTVARKRLFELATELLAKCNTRVGANLPWVHRP